MSTLCKFAALLFCLYSTGFAQQSTQVRLRETFDAQPEFWSFAEPRSSDPVQVKYENGLLKIVRTDANNNWFYRSVRMKTYSDFEIKLTYRMLHGVGTAGVGIHLLKNQEHYFFKMSHDVRTWVGKYSFADNVWTTINSLTEDNLADKPTKAGKPLRQQNELIVRRTGTTIAFLVNNEVVEIFQMNDKFPNIQEGVDAVGINFSGVLSAEVSEFSCDYNTHYIKLKEDAFRKTTKTFLTSLNDTNGAYSDRFGRVAPNGEAFYLIRNLGTTSDDIYIATPITDSTWQPAKDIGKPLNNSAANNVVAISQDNNMLYVWGRYNTDGEYNSPGLSSTIRTNNGWSVPSGVSIKEYKNMKPNREETISADRNVMILSIQDETSKGDRDLYVSFLEPDGSFSKPKNMGSINTDQEDAMPWLAADNKTLYFSTHKNTYGDADIVVSKRLDDTWLNWSEPINLGPTINTPGWDAYFSLHPNGKFAYMNTSNGFRAGIFRINFYADEASKELLPEPTVLVKGRVLDAKTKQPLLGTIKYQDLNTNKSLGEAISESMQGKYSIILPGGRTYSFFGSVPGYFPVSENLNIQELEIFQIVERDLLMVKLEVGATIRLNNIFFDTNKDQLKPESQYELERLVTLLQSSPSMAIEVAGHTDNVGNNDKNDKLSNNRAKCSAKISYSKGDSN